MLQGFSKKPVFMIPNNFVKVDLGYTEITKNARIGDAGMNNKKQLLSPFLQMTWPYASIIQSTSKFTR